MAVDLSKLPSAKLVTILRDYLLGITDVTDIFNTNIYSYRRADNAVQSLPSLNVYLESEKLIGNMLWLDGVIRIEGVIQPEKSREDVSAEVSYATNVLFLYLNTTDLINNALIDLPWIIDLGLQLNWDMKTSIGLPGHANKDAYLIKGTINYRINLLNYYYSVQPGDDIYEKASVIITPEPC